MLIVGNYSDYWEDHYAFIVRSVIKVLAPLCVKPMASLVY